MIKNIVIWLVKLLKLEEVFIAEFKAVVKARLNAKLSNLENVAHSIQNSKSVIDKIRGPQNISSFSLISYLDVIKNESLAAEKIIVSLKKEIEEEIDNLK